MEYILRYISYAMLASDPSILDDSCLNGLRETYLALGTPLNSVALAIQIMKLITIEVINKHNSLLRGNYNNLIAELSGYFDYVINALDGSYYSDADVLQIIQTTKISSNNQTDEDSKIVKNTDNQSSWEPSNYIEWLERDKLAQTLQKYGVDDPVMFKESAIRFFESWRHMPAQLKWEVWREREVMAALYEQMVKYWKNLPGFRSIAVAERVVDGRNQLAGIIVFHVETRNEYYRLWNIPKYINVKSSIKALQDKVSEKVPILLEWMGGNAKYSLDPVAIDILNILNDEVSKPTITLSVQSGDIIAGRNKSNRLANEQAVTLTTFVIPQNSSDISDIRILSVSHGFTKGYTEVNSCEVEPAIKIGNVLYSSIPQEELAKKLDVSLIKPVDTLQINPSLKWANIIPKPPIMWRSGMLVQMYGGTSKHQIGRIDYSQMLDLGPVSSVFPPFFTAIIPSKPGDSGSLLITGNDVCGDPFLNAAEKGYSESYLENMRFAMLGMLTEGTTGGTYQNMTVFIPIDVIFQYLKLQAYVVDK